MSTEVMVSSCTCVPGMRCRDHLGLVSYTEGVEDKVDKANLEQCNLRFKYQDANKARFSFPPPNDCGSLSCRDPCTKIWSVHGLARFMPSVWLP